MFKKEKPPLTKNKKGLAKPKIKSEKQRAAIIAYYIKKREEEKKR